MAKCKEVGKCLDCFCQTEKQFVIRGVDINMENVTSPFHLVSAKRGVDEMLKT